MSSSRPLVQKWMAVPEAGLDAGLPDMRDRLDGRPHLFDAEPVPVQDLPVAFGVQVGEAAENSNSSPSTAIER